MVDAMTYSGFESKGCEFGYSSNVMFHVLGMSGFLWEYVSAKTSLEMKKSWFNQIGWNNFMTL